MSEQLTFWVGNRNPSISENLIYADGTAVDLTGKTVKFKLREVGSDDLLVDQAATIVTPPGTDGIVRYDWSAADITAPAGALSSPRTALVWWEVTTTSGGRVQDYNEALIVVRAHQPETLAYVELEEFKSTAELSGTSFSDTDIRLALIAASRGIDEAFGRRFYPDADAAQVRYYSPHSVRWLAIDDLITLTSLATDQGGNGNFSDTWTVNTDFVLEPLNAAADGIPFQSVKANPRSSLYFPTAYPRSVKVTGKFGWAAVPAGVKEATTLVAARLIKRTREAPFGIVSFGLEGAAVRAAAMMRDPEFAFLAQTYSRNSGVA